MLMKISTLLYLTILTISLDVTLAQEAQVDPISETELQRREQSIPVIEERLKERNARITEMVEDIDRLDARIETRIAKIVKVIQAIKDSKDSKVMAARLKIDIMEGLGKSVSNYQRNRARLREELRVNKPKMGDDVTKRVVKVLDQKIEKRVDQILSISQSFAQHKDVEKYEDTTQSHGYYSWNSSKISGDWQQNRRSGVQTSKQRKEVMEALNSSIAGLERELKQHSLKVADKKLDPNTVEFHQAEISRITELLKTRKNQMLEVNSKSTGQTKLVTQRQVQELELQLRDIVKDIKSDNAELKRKVYQLKLTLVDYESVRANLESRKNWLKEYKEKNSN